MSVLGYVLTSDDRILDRLVVWRPSRFVRAYLLGASKVADGWLWVLCAALLVALGSRGLQVLAAATVAGVVANALLVVVKSRVRRPRPCARARPAAFDVDPLEWLACDRFSFPSGHALNCFTVGSVIALAYPASVPLVLPIAASVAASRVALGLHWLSDVIAGALAGVLIGSAVFLALVG